MKMKFLVILSFVLAFSFTQAQEDLTQTSIHGMLTGNQGQVIALAEAFSDASKMGFAPPEDVDMMGLSAITGKENVIAALKKSNAFVLEKILLVENDQLSNEVDFGFAKMNVLSGLLAIMEHNGEHKGQLIAYARSNNVTPPWSVK